MTGAQTLVRRLRNVPLFRSLEAEHSRMLVNGATLRTLRSHEVLYEQGQHASTCFVVLEGTVQFTVALGRQKVIAGLAVEHDVFGLEALWNRASRSETATAAVVAELLEVQGKVLKELLLDNPRFQFGLLKTVVAQLEQKSAHAVRTGHYNAEQRIAAYLIDHCADGASKNQGRIKAPSQADLADYLALTPETFCRKVGKFRRLGWIGGTGNEYVIKRQDSLQRLLER